MDYSPKADMWSLGMVLYYLCYSRLPYSIIDDVDILRSEILSFTDVLFPISRFDIYSKTSTFYTDAQNNPNIQSDIPNELKMLIRLLLSIDPIKRPSCNEILSKLRRIRRDDNTTVYQDMPTDWTNRTATDTTTIKPSTTAPVVVEEEEDGEEITSSHKRPTTTTTTSTTSTTSTTENSSTFKKNNSLRKRQRLLPNNNNDNNNKIDDEGDTIMAEEIAPTTRLLLEPSPSLISDVDESRIWITDKQSILVIKTVSVVLKVL
jgi:serine/threonine protein kinase